MRTADTLLRSAAIALCAVAASVPSFIASPLGGPYSFGASGVVSLGITALTSMAFVYVSTYIPKRRLYMASICLAVAVLTVEFSAFAASSLLSWWDYFYVRTEPKAIDVLLHVCSFAMLIALSCDSEHTIQEVTKPKPLFSAMLFCSGLTGHVLLRELNVAWTFSENTSILWAPLGWLLAAASYDSLAVLLCGLLLEPCQKWACSACYLLGAMTQGVIWRLWGDCVSGLTSCGTAVAFWALSIILVCLCTVFAHRMKLWSTRQDDHTDNMRNAAGANSPYAIAERALRQLDAGHQLGRREQEVLCCELMDLKTTETAKRLNIAKSTVSTHRLRAYEKLGVNSKQELLSRLLESASDCSEAVSSDSGAESHADRRMIKTALAYAGSVLVSFALSRMSTDLAAMAMASVSLAVAAEGMRLVLAERQDNGPTLPELLQGWSASVSVTLALAIVSSGASPDAVLFAILGGSIGSCCLAGYKEESVRALMPSCLVVAGTSGLALSNLNRLAAMPQLALLAIVFSLLSLGMLALAHRDRKARVAAAVLPSSKRAHYFLKSKGLGDLESEVVALSASGFSIPQIAKALHASSSYVSKARKKSFVALGAKEVDEVKKRLRDEGVM